MKEEMKTSHAVAILAIVAILVIGYFGITSYKNQQDKTQTLLTDQQKALRDAQQKITDLQKSNEQNKQAQATAQNNMFSLSDIVTKWRPDIARIECYWYDQNGALIMDAWGSGLLVNQNGASSYIIFTNTHVIHDQSQGDPRSCHITFPGTTESYFVNSNQTAIQTSNTTPNFDFGAVFIFNPGPYVQSNALVINYKSNIQTLSYCRDKASVGDSVVILGYPGIGSQNDITATEGIISGYDGYYYITSAKVEHGNSGGAAISLKNNCYLGIPSWAESGSVESLARILDFNYVYNHTP